MQDSGKNLRSKAVHAGKKTRVPEFRPQRRSIETLFRQLDQFNQAVDFWLRLGRHQLIELGFRQMVFQIPHHIKVLPPAIQNFEAWLLLIATDFTIVKWHGVAQPRATPHQFLGGIFHTGSVLRYKISFELDAKNPQGWKAWRLGSLKAWKLGGSEA